MPDPLGLFTPPDSDLFTPERDDLQTIIGHTPQADPIPSAVRTGPPPIDQTVSPPIATALQRSDDLRNTLLAYFDDPNEGNTLRTHMAFRRRGLSTDGVRLPSRITGVQGPGTNPLISEMGKQLADEAFGKGWYKFTRDRDDLHRLQAIAATAAIANQQVIGDEDDTPESDAWVQSKIMSTMRAPETLGVTGAATFKTAAEALRGAVHSPLVTENDLGIMSKWYKALFNQEAGDDTAAMMSALKPVVANLELQQSRARRMNVYTKLGVMVGEGDFVRDGVDPRALARTWWPDAMVRFNTLYGLQASPTDADSVAFLRTHSYLNDQIQIGGEAFLKAISPDGLNERDQALAKEIDAVPQDKRLQWFAERLRGTTTMESWLKLNGSGGPEHAQYLQNVQARWTAAVDTMQIQERADHDQRLKQAELVLGRIGSEETTRANEQVLQEAVAWRRVNQGTAPEATRETASEGNLLIKAYDLPGRLIGEIADLTGLSSLTPRFREISQAIIDAIVDPEDRRLYKSAKGYRGEQLMEHKIQNVSQLPWHALRVPSPWPGAIPEYAWENYQTKKELGRAAWSDHIAAFGWAIWDDIAHIPEAVENNPALAAAVTAALVRTVPMRHALVQKAGAAGLPDVVVGGLQLVAEFETPWKGINTMLGVDPVNVAKFGSTSRKAASLINQHADMAEPMLQLQRRMNEVITEHYLPELRVEEQGTAALQRVAQIEHNLEAYSTAVQMLWTRALKRETIPVGDVRAVMRMAEDVPAEFARPMLLPAHKLAPMRVRDALAARAIQAEELAGIDELDTKMMTWSRAPTTLDSLPIPPRPTLSSLFFDAVEQGRAVERQHILEWTIGADNVARGKTVADVYGPQAGKIFDGVMARIQPSLERRRMAPQADKHWAGVLAAWQQSNHKGRQMSILYEEMRDVFRSEADDRLNATQLHTAALRSLEREFARSEPKVQARMLPELERMRACATQYANEYELYSRISNKVNKASADIDGLLQFVLRRPGQWPNRQGLEQGYKADFSADERHEIALRLVDVMSLMRSHSAQFGIPQSFFRALMDAEQTLGVDLDRRMDLLDRATDEQRAALGKEYDIREQTGERRADRWGRTTVRDFGLWDTTRRDWAQPPQTRQEYIEDGLRHWTAAQHRLESARAGMSEARRAQHDAILRSARDFQVERPALVRRILEGNVEAADELLRVTRQGVQMDDILRHTLAERLASDDTLWSIGPLMQEAREMVEGVRRRRTQLAAVLDDVSWGSQSALPYDLLRMMTLWNKPKRLGLFGTQASTMVGEVGLAIEAGTNPVYFLNAALDRAYSSMPRELQYVADEMLAHPERLSFPNTKADQLVDWLVQNDTRIRNKIAEYAFRNGRISQEMYSRIRNEGYDPHFYLEFEATQDLKLLGYNVRTSSMGGLGDTLTGTMSRMNARTSPTEMRVFFRERGGHYASKTFPLGDKTQAEVRKEAKAWIDFEVEAGKLDRNTVSVVDFQDDLLTTALGPIGRAEGAVAGAGTQGHRWDALRRLLADSERLELFRQIAQNGNWARLSIDDLRLKERGQWTPEPVKGTEWGELEGYHVNLELFRTINEHTQFSRVLDSAAASIKEQIGQLWSTTWLQSFSEGIANGSIVAKLLGNGVGAVQAARTVASLGRALGSIYHSIIVKSAETWVTAHVTDGISAGLAGVNPLSRQFQADMRIHHALSGDVGEGHIWERSVTDSDRQAYQFLSEQGQLSETIGATPSMLGHALKGTPFLKLFRKVEEVHGDRVTKAERYVTEIEDTLRGIAAKRFKDGPSDLLDAQEIKFRELRQLALSELNKLTALNPFGRISHYLGGKTPSQPLFSSARHKAKSWLHEARTMFFDTNDSVFSQYMSIKYSSIDAAYKFATFRQLTRGPEEGGRGLSFDDAVPLIDTYFQNYNRVPPSVKALKRLPFAGAMVPSFPFEAVRIMRDSARLNPGQISSLILAPMAWNWAMLTSQGLAPDDLMKLRGYDSRTQALTDMMTSVYMPIGGGQFVRLNIGKYSFAAPFLYPTGLMAPGIEATTRTLEQTMGSAVAAPASGIMNLASQFFFNKPWPSALIKVGTGVDVFDREIRIDKANNYDVGSAALEEAGKLFMPRTITSLVELNNRYGPPSPITGHERTLAQALLGALTGVNYSRYKYSEAVGSLATKYLNVGGVVSLYRDLETIKRRDLAERLDMVRRLYDAGDLEGYTKEANTLAQALSKEAREGPAKFIGGRRVSPELTVDRALSEIVNYVGRDVYGTIDRVPVNMVPELALDAATCGFVPQDSAELAYIWAQIQSPEKLHGVESTDDIKAALDKVAQMAEVVTSQPTSGNLERAALSLATEYLTRKLQSPGRAVALATSLVSSTRARERVNLQRFVLEIDRAAQEPAASKTEP